MAKADKQAAIQAHKAARENLAKASSKTSDANDPAYLAANRAVIAAEKNIPWYRR